MTSKLPPLSGEKRSTKRMSRNTKKLKKELSRTKLKLSFKWAMTSSKVKYMLILQS